MRKNTIDTNHATHVIDFIPDDSASHEWTEYDSHLVAEYAEQLRTINLD
ncbi:hypothetical protein KIH75_01570 [Bifidobacterium sp. 64T4]|nr:hypothetical protein [Bifidobacterium pongonis]MBW3094058.1 hypothetical protein [Bifidobacterium pongonis]